MAATKSPSYVLLRGTQYLRRASNDTSLNPTSSGISVSLTVDPEAFGAASNGTVVGKFRGDNNQRGWKVEYQTSNGTLKFTIYGAGDGSIYSARETAAAVRFRTSVVFTADGTTGAVDVYVNGTLANGTATSGGTFAAPVASTEPLAIGADSHSAGSALNVWKGAVYHLAIFDLPLTSGDIAGQLADGILTVPLAALSSLKAYWKHDTIAGATTDDYTSWIDTKSSFGLTATVVSGGAVKVQTETGGVLTINRWDADLSDLALGSQGLTTTYTNSPPYRIWGSGLSEPQIASGYRGYKGDWTIVVRCRRVAGKSTSVLLRRRGFFLQYTFASKELFAFLGDDNVGSDNRRISWGFNLFPIEGVDAVLVLRHNAIDRDVDLFINQIKFNQVTNIASTSNEQTTGLYLSEGADFLSSVATLGCLSDAQVDKFVLGLAQNTYSVAVTTLGPATYAPQPRTPVAIAEPAAVTTFTFAATIRPAETVYSALPSTNSFATYTGVPYLPTQSNDSVDNYDPGDPDPEIISLTYSGGVVSVTGRAGPYNSERSRTWYEIEIRPGSFQAVGAQTYPRDFFTGRNDYPSAFQTMPEFDADGRTIRLAVQPHRNAKLIYYSDPVAVAATLPTDPNLDLLTAVVNGDGTITTSFEAGPTNAGALTVWWEIETTPGSSDYQRVTGFYTGEIFNVRTTYSKTFAVGSSVGWTNRRIRARLQVEASPQITYTSDLISLVDFTYTNPVPAVTTASVSPLRVITASGTVGPTTAGLVSVWWELTLNSGETVIVADVRTGVNATTIQTINDTFPVPPNFSLNGRELRLVVRPDVDRATTFASTAYTLSVSDFVSPAPTMTSATATLNKLLTASATTVASDGGPVTRTWELLNDVGEWTSLLDPTPNVAISSNVTHNLSYQFPNKLSINGKGLRLVLRSETNPDISWTSSTLAVTEAAPITPTFTITSADQNSLRNLVASGSIGPTNIGNVDVYWEIEVDPGEFVIVAEPELNIATSTTLSTPVSANANVVSDVSGLGVRIVVRSVTFPELVYKSDPFTITSSTSTGLTMAMTTASYSALGVLSFAGTVDPASVGLLNVWFEIEVQDSGNFTGRFIQAEDLDPTAGLSRSGTSVVGTDLPLTGKFARLAAELAGDPSVKFYSAPLAISIATITSPDPAVTSAIISPAGVFNATGLVGPSNVGSAITYWEIEHTPNEFTVVFETEAAPNMASDRVAADATVTPPARLGPDLAGKSVRLVVQSAANKNVFWKSSAFALTVQTYTGTILAVNANVSIQGIWTATATIGVNNFGNNWSTWWEVEVTANEFRAVIDPTTRNIAGAGQTMASTTTLVTRFDLDNKSARFAMSPVGRPEVVYYSDTILVDSEFVSDPGPIITSLSTTYYREVNATSEAGPTNVGLCDTWWEIQIGDDFTGRYNLLTNVNLVSRRGFIADFTLPPGYDYTNKTARFVVRPVDRAEVIYYSPPVQLNVPAAQDPGPVVQSVTVDETYLVTFTGTTLIVTALGLCTVWYELTLPAVLGGLATLDTVSTSYDPLVPEPITYAFVIPEGWDLRGSEVVLCISPNNDREIVFKSLPFIIEGKEYNRFNCLGEEVRPQLRSPGQPWLSTSEFALYLSNKSKVRFPYATLAEQLQRRFGDEGTLGSAVFDARDAIEQSWVSNTASILASLGFPPLAPGVYARYVAWEATPASPPYNPAAEPTRARPWRGTPLG